MALAVRALTNWTLCGVDGPKSTVVISVPTEAPIKSSAGAPPGMVWIPGGEFAMGSNGTSGDKSLCAPRTLADTQPIHQVHIDGFWMDETDVTNAEFEKFVATTGCVTVAERAPTKEEFPGASPENLVAGSAVFTPTAQAVPLNDHFQWWTYVKGANWRHPEGPPSTIKGKENYPVVQVAYGDALASAKWAGKRLPTEAEWEFAARGGLTGKTYAWGNEFKPNGRFMANTYQGQFPVEDTAADGFAGIAPVKSFAPNGYGLYDMAGSVWQWCSDWYRSDYFQQVAAAGGIARNPQGPQSSFDPAEPGVRKRAQKGGSFLCSDHYCIRYMVGTRGKSEPGTATNHAGFRCVKDAN